MGHKNEIMGAWLGKLWAWLGQGWIMWHNFPDYEIFLVTINGAMLRSCPNHGPTLPQACPVPHPYPNRILTLLALTMPQLCPNLAPITFRQINKLPVISKIQHHLNDFRSHICTILCYWNIWTIKNCQKRQDIFKKSSTNQV